MLPDNALVGIIQNLAAIAADAGFAAVGQEGMADAHGFIAFHAHDHDLRGIHWRFDLDDTRLACPAPAPRVLLVDVDSFDHDLMLVGQDAAHAGAFVLVFARDN